MSSSSSFFSGTNPTPTEYQTAVDLVAQATEKATAALASSNSSAASATSSQNYSIAAGNSATSAANQAASAATSATNAATSATSASNSAATATTQATTATNQATTATTQATNSATSASASSASATAAATSATNAASSATAAATSASNAAATLAGAMVKTNNLSDVSNASTARTNLGVAIGSNVQAWDADLDAIAALAGTSGLLKKTAANTWSLDTTSYLSGTVPVANGGTGGTTSTGSGSVVLANSPTLVTPALGTPSSGNLANCTFPTLNQNTTGTASNVTGTVAVANGGTGLTSLTAGYIPFGAGTSAFGNSANLFWDNTNARLGIGTSSPSSYGKLASVSGSASVPAIVGVHGGTLPTITAGTMGIFAGSLGNTTYGTRVAILGGSAGLPGLYFGSELADSNGGIQYSNASNYMAFLTNGANERMRIDSSGNVGIGGTPAAKLHVSSPDTSIIALIAGATKGVRFGTTGSTTQIEGVDNTGTASYQPIILGGLDVRFTCSGTERMRIDSSGLIGINTTTGPNVQVNIGGLGPSSSNTTYSVYLAQTIPAASTTVGNGFTTSLSTQAAAFTCTSINHFQANQGTIGNGSIVSNQFGYAVPTLTAATNNFGFYSNIAINPGSQTLAASTISTIASSGTTTTVVTTAAHGLTSTQTVTVAATANATALVSGATVTILTVGTTDFTLIGASSNTVGLSFTATGAGTGTGTVRINQQGSGKTVTVVDTTTFTYTSTTGTFAAITASGSVTPCTRFNIYSTGTAPSYFGGGIGLGTTNPRGKLELSSASPSMAFTQSTAALDNKTWDILASGGNFAIRTLNDVYSAASTAFTIGRTDNLVTSHVWYTSNVERMRLDSSGNVGIGVVPTSLQLDIGGNTSPTVRCISTTGSVDMRLQSIGASGVGIVGTYSNSPVVFYTNANERMRIDSAGSLLIGATSSLGYNATGRGVIVVNGSTEALLGFGAGGTGKGYVYHDGTNFNWINQTSTGATILGTNGAERMRIDSSGNVGIGTTTPTSKLVVSGTNASGAIAAQVANFDTSGSSSAQFNIYHGSTTSLTLACGNGYTGLNSSTASAYMYFATNNTERMRIDSAGNVGIANTSPSVSLHIGNTSVAADRTIRVTNSHMPTGFDMVVSSGGAGGYLWVRDNSFMSLGTNNTERARIDASGNLLVGTTSSPTSGTQCLTIETGTAATASPADTITVYSTDLSAGNTMLSLYTEGTPVNANTTAAATHRIAIRVNGTVYYLLANTAA